MTNTFSHKDDVTGGEMVHCLAPFWLNEAGDGGGVREGLAVIEYLKYTFLHFLLGNYQSRHGSS